MTSLDASVIKPSITLNQAPLKALNPARLMTINGSMYWVSLVSKTSSSKEEYHHLDNQQWETLKAPIQRIFLANIQSASEHKAVPLIEKDPQAIEIPINAADNSISYKKNETDYFLSPKEMQSLSAFKGHDLMKELRQALRGYPLPPYFSETEQEQVNLRLEALKQDYSNKHHLIHQLHIDMKKDIDLKSFNFYKEELSEPHATALPISPAQDFNLDQLNTTQPLFIPLEAHSISHSIMQKIKKEPPTLSPNPHLLGLFFDPATHEVIVYDPSHEKKGTHEYPDLEKILTHLKQKDPDLTVTYQGSEKTTHNQAKRQLLLFFHTMLTAKDHPIPSARLPARIQTLIKNKFFSPKMNEAFSSTSKENALKALKQNLPHSLEERCQILAQKLQIQYNRAHEIARVTGS